MQRIFNYEKWIPLEEGGALELSNTKPRRVRLEVNAPGPASIWITAGPPGGSDGYGGGSGSVHDPDAENFLAAAVPEQGDSSQSGPFFLAAVEAGRDTIEFHVNGKVSLTVTGAGIMVYTADSDDISSVVLDPVIFTKIASRRRRNPELEYIAFQMQRNIERRMEQQNAQLQRLLERGLEVRQVLKPPEGVHGVSRGQSRAALDAEPPGSPAPADGGSGEASLESEDV